MSSFKKNNPGISKGLSVKKFGFWTFSQKRYFEFFDFLHDDKGQRCATFWLVLRFIKIIQGLAGDEVSKYWLFCHLLGNATISVIDRGQHCATIELGVRFQKTNSRISRGLIEKNLGFLSFSWKRYYRCFWFFALL